MQFLLQLRLQCLVPHSGSALPPRDPGARFRSLPPPGTSTINPTAGARRSPSRTAYALELRLWIDSKPEVPEDDWYKDFGSFKICGKGALPKTFLLRGQAAKGKAVSQSRGKPTVTQTFKRFPASFQPITGINPRNPEIHPLSSKQDRRGVALCVRLPAPEPPCLLPAKLKPKPKPPPPPTPVVEPAGAKSLTASPKTTSPRIGFVPSTPAPVPTPGACRTGYARIRQSGGRFSSSAAIMSRLTARKANECEAV